MSENVGVDFLDSEQLYHHLTFILVLSFVWRIAVLKDKIVERTASLKRAQPLPRVKRPWKRRRFRALHRSYKGSEWWFQYEQVRDSAVRAQAFEDSDVSAEAEQARDEFVHWSKKFR
jgi:hypothetical protein